MYQLRVRLNEETRAKIKLRVEFVPAPIWQFNLRSKEGLGKYRWDKYRRKLITEGHNKCRICGSTEKLEGHEVWRYKNGSRGSIAKLVRVEIVCQECHFIKHWGQAQRVASNAGLLALKRHFRKVNRCSEADFDRHITAKISTWKRRSSNPNWKIDWGDFEPAVEEAAAARQKWTARHPQPKRRFGRAPITSGLPRQAAVFGVRRHVSKVPLSNIAHRRRPLSRFETSG